mmetsp:Transcript_46921/g.109447  ORF Transcript_46921/g.109447 Transcript_46921/m.109447 type:complete len:250 (+) Transcript_46921:247-996(+)
MPPRPRARSPHPPTLARSRGRPTSRPSREPHLLGLLNVGSSEPSEQPEGLQLRPGEQPAGLRQGLAIGRSAPTLLSAGASAGTSLAEWHASPAGQRPHPVALCSASVPAWRHRQQKALQNALLVRGGQSSHGPPLCAGCRHLLQLLRHGSSPGGQRLQIALGCAGCLHRACMGAGEPPRLPPRLSARAAGPARRGSRACPGRASTHLPRRCGRCLGRAVFPGRGGRECGRSTGWAPAVPAPIRREVLSR